LPRAQKKTAKGIAPLEKTPTESVFTQVPSDGLDRSDPAIDPGKKPGGNRQVQGGDANKLQDEPPKIVPENPEPEKRKKDSQQNRPRRNKLWLTAAIILAILIAGTGITLAFLHNSGANSSSVAVKSIKFSSESLALMLEDTQQLAYEITPADAKDKSVVWSSDNTEVATVDEDGVVTAIGAGSAVITVKTIDGNKMDSLTVTVTNKVIALASIVLNKDETIILIGESEQLLPLIEPVDATNQKVTWKSSNEKVAAVNDQGKVTAVAVGTATITANTEEGNRTASCTVSVSNKAVAATGVKLNKTSLTLKVGTSDVLIATIAPADATNQNLTWSTSDSSVATIGYDGKVTALKRGTATISVTTDEGAYTATCKVTVTQPVTSVSLDKTSITLNNGSSIALKATVNPADANNKNIIWSSSNTNVAAVDSSGKVTAKGKGEAKITVKTEDGGKMSTCAVTVVQPPTSVTLNKSNTTINVGGTETLTATVKPDNADNKSVTWTSSNTGVATVNSSGVVTAKAKGTATITATTVAGGLQATCAVTVLQQPTSVTLNKSGTTLYVGDSETLIATVKPDNANNKSVTWSSSNSAVASVDANGRITAKGAGKATITATTVVSGKAASCSVTVKPLTKAIFIGAGKYGNFGSHLNNYCTIDSNTTIYQFEFYTSNIVPTDGYLFNYYWNSQGMAIYFNSEKKLSVNMRYSDNATVKCLTTTFLPSTKYKVTVSVTNGKRPVITINGVTQTTTVEGGHVGYTLNSATKYLGSTSATRASNVYITGIYICGTPPGNSKDLKIFSANMSSYGVGTTSISSGGVTLNLTGASVKEYKLP
jgi:uncharacterized protein YjdB